MSTALRVRMRMPSRIDRFRTWRNYSLDTLDFSEYLERFEAVCKQCNVTHDLFNAKPQDFVYGCPACQAARDIGFAFNVEFQGWVHSAKARVDIEQRMVEGLAVLFPFARPGAPISNRLIIRIEERPNRLVLEDPAQPGRYAIIDFPTGTSEAVQDDYKQRFGAAPATFDGSVSDPTLKLFEEVHQVERQVATGTRVEPAS